MSFVQAVLVLRIWYTNRDAPIIRFGVALCYIGNIVTIGILMAPVWRDITSRLPQYYVSGCASMQTTHAWRLFVPGIVMYSVIYAATIIPALREWYHGRNSMLMHRTVRK